MKKTLTVSIFSVLSLLVGCSEPISPNAHTETASQEQGQSSTTQSQAKDSTRDNQTDHGKSNPRDGDSLTNQDYERGHDLQYSKDPSYKARYDEARKEYRDSDSKFAQQLFPNDLAEQKHAQECFEKKAKRTFYCKNHLGREYRGDCEKLQQGC